MLPGQKTTTVVAWLRPGRRCVRSYPSASAASRTLRRVLEQVCGVAASKYARGALTRLNDFDGHDTYFRYDAAGRRTVKQLPNGMLTYHGYDAASQASWTVNRKSDLAHLSSVYYEYNGDSLPTWQYRRGEFSVDHQYVYDDVPRLAVERVFPPGDHVDPIYSFGYYYDGNSRRYALIREDMGLTYYAYDASDALQTIQHPDGNWAYYSYDADGNTTEITSTGGDAGTAGTTYYEWDSENLMTSARVPGVETENEFTWNADSQRVSRVDSSGTLSFLRDGQKLIAEKTGGGVLAARYVNEGDSLYSWLVSDKQDTTRRYPTFDLLGTVHDFVGSGQTLLGSNLFEAYGTRPASATGTVTGPYGYVGALGYHYDPDPALHLLSIRHYNARTGAFVSRDRVPEQAAYAYARAQATLLTDPTGWMEDNQKACIIEAANQPGNEKCREAWKKAHGGDLDLFYRLVRCIIEGESTDLKDAIGECTDIGTPGTPGYWAGKCLGPMQLCPNAGTLRQCEEAGYPISGGRWCQEDRNIGCGIKKLCDECIRRYSGDYTRCSRLFNVIGTEPFNACMADPDSWIPPADTTCRPDTHQCPEIPTRGCETG